MKQDIMNNCLLLPFVIWFENSERVQSTKDVERRDHDLHVLLRFYHQHTSRDIFVKILSNCATGEKYQHKFSKGNTPIMQIMNKQENIVSELAKCVTRMKAQLTASVT